MSDRRTAKFSIKTSYCHSEQSEESVPFGIQVINEKCTDPEAKPQDDNFIHIKKKAGFTLAEVLVTLAIIGVVAALTIPGLIQSVQKNQYEAALKKNYSVIVQAYTSLHADGIEMTDAFPGADPYGTSALNILATKLNVLKNCGHAAGCWYNSPLYKLDGTEYYANIDLTFLDWGAMAQLMDGTLIRLKDYNSGCSTFNPAALVPSNFLPGANLCGEIEVDVNGRKGPNKFGRDVFGFWATKTGIYPFGSYGDGILSSCDNASAGWGCAARVVTTGMNY